MFNFFMLVVIGMCCYYGYKRMFVAGSNFVEQNPDKAKEIGKQVVGAIGKFLRK